MNKSETIRQFVDASETRGTLWKDLVEIFREIVEHRELLLQMTLRDLLLRYKQTVMGFGWAIFMPVLNMLIFSFLFTRVVPLDTGVPYPLFAYCGLLPWNFLASSLKFSAVSLNANISLVTKIYFPREIIPISLVFVCLVDFAVASSVLVALMFYYKASVSWSLLFLPVVLLVQIALTTGLSLLIAMGNLFYRDIKYLFEVVLAVGMFVTPVVYPLDRIHGKLKTLMVLNPMAPIIEAYRSVLLRGTLPDPGPFLLSVFVSILILVGGWVIFHRAEFKFAENI
ncbi:MAG: ABC transporter permease [Acidobacteriota bacterium]